MFQSYRPPDRLASQVLGALYCADMYRPLVRDRKTVSRALAAAVLAELSGDGLIHAWQGLVVACSPVAPANHGADTMAQQVLRDIRNEPAPLPVSAWMNYLADHAPTLVWQRLVDNEVARSHATRTIRRRTRFELTEIRAMTWALQALAMPSCKQELDTAIVLWWILTELRLTSAVLDPDMLAGLRPGPRLTDEEAVKLRDAITAAYNGASPPPHAAMILAELTRSLRHYTVDI